MKARLLLVVAFLLSAAGLATAQLAPAPPPYPDAVILVGPALPLMEPLFFPRPPGDILFLAAAFGPDQVGPAPAPGHPMFNVPVPPPPHDPVSGALFPPELILAHQRAIGLQPEQKTYIREEMRKAQLRFTELHWQLQDSFEALAGVLEQEQVTESQALAQLERVLDTERQIKTLQIGLMVRLKNKLTPEQRAQLKKLRPQPPAPPAPPHSPAPPARPE